MSGTAKAAGGDPCWGAGRGAGGARRVGRHGWRMASLLSTLPLPLLPVVAFSTSHPQSGATVLSTISLEPPSNDALPCPPHLCASWAPAVQAPLSFGLRQLGLRAPLSFLGLRAAAPSRARGSGLSLDRAVLSSSRAPSPVTRFPPTSTHTYWRACAVHLPLGECATRAPERLTPFSGDLLPHPHPFHDFLSPLQPSRSTSSIPRLAGT